MPELDAWVPTRCVAPVILNSPPATSDVADPGQVKQLGGLTPVIRNSRGA